ncbi:MAG: 2,3-bisphosphoglycerate-independent phosphoglycerate mutase [Flavobacteriales bacterium]|nr:2,3-bisphosphoglycerate-independent phosphoglycerate mutase [Flavobacteriales bacterium]
MKKKVALIVLDGWGHGAKNESNAIFCASTPFTDNLYNQYPNAQLRTDGENVGLPQGQMGNSEVGHMNIGAGRIVYQDLARINLDIHNGLLASNTTLKLAFETAIRKNVPLHLMGLLSDGGVHSHIDHLKAICTCAIEAGVRKILIHVFTDGRDTDPRSALGFINDLEKHITNSAARITTISGRYFAMDRDLRWERISKSYHTMVSGEGLVFETAKEAIESSYNLGVTDEFILPCRIGNHAELIKDDDVVLCFNFRTDRCREITRALTQELFPDFKMRPLNLEYYTMTNYDDTFKNVKSIYVKDNLGMTLGEMISVNGLTQIRIAETEKYPHVSFFFSGGRENPFDGENRIMINSPKVSTYDLQPEMSAPDVANAICAEMEKNAPDFVCLNFANADMVGHTGVFPAIVKAVETVDKCLQQVVECGLNQGYSFVILADHGNAEKALNEDGTPNTAHTTNPVPVWVIDGDVHAVSNGVLADVAPTILKILGLSKPTEMTGNSLV